MTKERRAAIDRENKALAEMRNGTDNLAARTTLAVLAPV